MEESMKIISKHGDPDLAEVFVAQFRGNKDLTAEFVDARDPKLQAHDKWVIIISTQFGCPISCLMCDAGGDFRGDMTAYEMLSQIEYVVGRHGRERLKSTGKFKVQFARMGEPALNRAVLDVLRMLPAHFDAPGLIPCVATVAPLCAESWFDELLEIRRDVYGGRPFQLQLSINSTDKKERDRLMPVPKMSLYQMGLYAKQFASHGPRKVGLNFALTNNAHIDPEVIAQHFDPKSACIKITPLNPTSSSVLHGLESGLEPDAQDKARSLADTFLHLGFDVILSIGDNRENSIGSNCGMAVRKLRSKAA